MLNGLPKTVSENSWQVRVASADDSFEVSNLVNSAYRGDYSKTGWTTEADILGGQRTDPKAIHHLIQDENSVILVLPGENDSLLACVHLEKKNQDVAYLGMLTVDPKLQKAGVGKFLLKASEDFVNKTWKTSMMEMTVISVRGELISWYCRRGYQLSAEKRPFPMTDPRFGIPKRADLEFVVLTKNI